MSDAASLKAQVEVAGEALTDTAAPVSPAPVTSGSSPKQPAAAAAPEEAAAGGAADQNGGEAASPSPSKSNKRNKKKNKGASSPAPAATPADAADDGTEASPGTDATPTAAAASSPAAAVAAQEEAAPATAAPAAPAAPEAAAAAERRASSGFDLPEGAVPSVKALQQQLSQNGAVALAGGIAQPAAPEPRPEGPAQPRVSEHDKLNTTNALELLQTGAFKLLPGKDTVPYEQLVSLRLEDGIDVTRKEEYLTSAEFSEVFKMDKAAFQQLPQWKRLQLKKSSRLF